MITPIKNLEKDVLIAYHAKCVDGFTAAWVTAKATGSSTLLAMEYNDASVQELYKKLEQCEFDTLYVVDFSLDVAVLQQLVAKHPKLQVIVLDHHKTAFERYTGFPNVPADASITLLLGNIHIVLDNTLSGAGLCWDFFHGTPAPKIVAYAQDYDLWQFKLGEDTKYAHQVLASVDFTLDAYTELATKLQVQSTRTEVLEVGKRMEDSHTAAAEDIASRAKKAVLNTTPPTPCYAVSCDRAFGSKVGNILAAKYGVPAALYTFNEIRETVCWSLRSVGDTDVSALASQYGGGGHKNAAGFELHVRHGSPIHYLPSGD